MSSCMYAPSCFTIVSIESHLFHTHSSAQISTPSAAQTSAPPTYPFPISSMSYIYVPPCPTLVPVAPSTVSKSFSNVYHIQTRPKKIIVYKL